MFYVFLCLGLVYCWAAVSALLCLAVPPKCSTCQLHDQLVHLGNKLIDTTSPQICYYTTLRNTGGQLCITVNSV